MTGGRIIRRTSHRDARSGSGRRAWKRGPAVFGLGATLLLAPSADYAQASVGSEAPATASSQIEATATGAESADAPATSIVQNAAGSEAPATSPTPPQSPAALSEASQAPAASPSPSQIPAASPAPSAAASPERPRAQAAVRMTLEEAIRLAVARNPQITGADLELLLAQLAETRARLDRFSASLDVTAGNTGSVTFGSTRVNAYDPTAEPDYTYRPLFGNSLSYGAQATVSVPLYTGGLVTANINRSTVNVKLEDVDRELLRRDLARAVFQAWWSIAGYELQRAAAEEALKQSREALSIIEAKQKTGLAAPLELNRFQVDVLSQEQRLSELELQAYRGRQELLRLLHVEGEDIELVETPQSTAPGQWPAEAAPLIELARKARLELVSLDLALEGSHYDRDAATSAYRPTVSLDLTANAGGQADWVYQPGGVITGPDTSEDLSTLDDATFAPGLNLSAGVNLRWNLFNRKKTAYEVDRVDVAMRQLKVRRIAEQDQIDEEVKSAHQQLLNLKRRETSVNRQLELARDNLNIIQTLYGQGSATILDLFDAQGSYRSALQQEATQRVNLSLAEYELRWAIGEAFAP